MTTYKVNDIFAVHKALRKININTINNYIDILENDMAEGNERIVWAESARDAVQQISDIETNNDEFWYQYGKNEGIKTGLIIGSTSIIGISLFIKVITLMRKSFR